MENTAAFTAGLMLSAIGAGSFCLSKAVASIDKDKSWLYVLGVLGQCLSVVPILMGGTAMLLSSPSGAGHVASSVFDAIIG